MMHFLAQEKVKYAQNHNLKRKLDVEYFFVNKVGIMAAYLNAIPPCFITLINAFKNL